MSTRSSISLVLLAAALTGCQSWKKADEDARQVALVTSQRVLTVKKEIARKIAAERKYYKAQLDTIQKSQARFDESALRRASIVEAQKQAADLMANAPGLNDAAITSRVLSSSTNLFEQLHTAHQARQEQRALLEKSIRDLELLEAQYDVLNKTLIQLTTPPTTRSQMAQLAIFIKNVSDDYEKLKKEAAANSPTP